MIGVIGLGGAGGNIAHSAHERGFLTAAINYSQKDLDSIEVKHKLKLHGSEGVGKDRRQAARLFEDQIESTCKFIQERFNGCELIVVAFSSSGGSGGGIGCLLIDVLKNLLTDTVICAFVVVPDLKEVTIAQANCMEAFEELSMTNVAVFPIDNRQAVKAQLVGKNKVFEYTNSKAIDLLRMLVDYTDLHSRNGNFDKRDFLTVMNTAGIATICEVELTDIDQHIKLSSEWVATRIQSSLKESVFVPVESEKVTRAAVIFDGQEALLEYLDYDLIFSCFKNGTPIELYEGSYHQHNGKVLMILSGLAWCSSRLQDIEISMNSNEDRISSTLIETGAYKSNSGDLLSRLKRQSPEPKKSMTDILSKYKR